MKLASGSFSWIIFPLCCGVVFGVVSLFSTNELQYMSAFLTLCMIIVVGFFLLFFRDPHRVVGEGLVAVGDGRIRTILKINEDVDCGPCICVSTFMNIYNVHVNRCPFNGTVIDIIHHRGLHLPAFTKESIKNERVIILLETSFGVIKIIQIAGTLARRIVPYIRKGDVLKKGDRIGLIRLGSRVDIYIPKLAINKITVKPLQMIKAGVTCLASIHD